MLKTEGPEGPFFVLGAQNVGRREIRMASYMQFFFYYFNQLFFFYFIGILLPKKEKKYIKQ